MNSKRMNLIFYLLPSVLGNCSYFLYKICNGVFVGQGISADALGAMNLAYPIVLIAYAVFTLIAIGGVTIAVIRLGQENVAGANQVFMHALAGTLVASTLLTILGYIFADAIAVFLGANATYHSMVVDYLRCYCIFLIPTALFTVLSGFCRNDGAPGLSSAATVVYTVINIVGDWLFLVILGKGIRGAVYSAGIAAIVSDIMMIPHFCGKRGELKMCAFQFRPAILGEILGRGMPEMVSQFFVPVTTLSMNRVLVVHWGDSAVNAFSIISYVTSLFTNLSSGMVGGLQPLFGRSYGAKDYEGLRYYFRNGLSITAVCNGVVFLFIVLLGPQICNLFGADAATYEVTLSALPKYATAYLFAGLSIVCSSYLYSIRLTRQALILNICRCLVLNSLLVFGLTYVFGKEIVWYVIPIAELLSLVIGVFIISRRKDVVQ